MTGIAWELGVLQALQEAGVDLTAADLVVGTSAGSVVAVQATRRAFSAFTHSSPEAQVLEPDLAEGEGDSDPAGRGGPFTHLIGLARSRRLMIRAP